MTLTELSAALAARGLIAENQLAIAPGPEGNPSPWYVQVMMGACAWFSGLLLFLFVALGLASGIRQNWGVVLFLGICACGAAAFLYATIAEKSSFGDQFALAMSIGGQFAIAISIGEMSNVRTALWVMLFLEIALIFAMRNRLHRILSAFGAVVAWALATHEILFHEIPGVTWFHSRPSVYQISLPSVLLWFAVWAPVVYAASRLVAGEARWMADGRETLLRPVTHGLIASLAIAPLATHPSTFWMALGMDGAANLTDASLGATALWPFLALLLALLALALGFALRNRPLIGVAIVFALLDVSAFYYILGTTLIVKSIIMLVLGAGLLVSAQLLARESQ